MGDEISDEILLDSNLVYLTLISGIAGCQASFGSLLHKEIAGPFQKAQAFQQLSFVRSGAKAQDVIAALVTLIGIAGRQQPAELRLGGHCEAQDCQSGENRLLHKSSSWTPGPELTRGAADFVALKSHITSGPHSQSLFNNYSACHQEILWL
jgi:hypothetical protein